MHRIGHEKKIASKRFISSSRPCSTRQPALSFFWQRCQSIQRTILVTRKANRNENIVSERTHGVNGDAGSGVNHLAGCAPPFCCCHLPQHICHWEKKYDDWKLHSNKLLCDTNDHFYEMKLVCSANMECVPPLGTHMNVETHIQVDCNHPSII